ncbi:hypothetical protein IKE79_00060 [Candidatus Saccharibacteria bacterium]|nr:hypothetical protein [Candidatus Saccharibacteria bacterium]
MDKNVAQSIKARQDALSASYNITDKSLQDKIAQLFKKISQLGEECKSSEDFEAKFAASPLNQAYLDLFTEVATKSQPRQAAPAPDMSIVKDIAKQSAKEGAIDNAARGIREAVLPTRASVHQAAYDAASRIPGVGEAMSIKQHVDFFSRFRKKKDK